MKVSVGVSNRHVHLTEETYNILFDEELTKFRDLDQPGQFAANQKITIKNNDREINNVRIVGPFRSYNQVELSRTDCYAMKIEAPVRDSGNLKDTNGITLIGPKGSVQLDKGVIIANRHIHITPNDLDKYKLKESDIVEVHIKGEKGGQLNNVHLKVQETASLRLHLDTDDANAFNIKNNDIVEFAIYSQK